MQPLPDTRVRTAADMLTSIGVPELSALVLGEQLADCPTDSHRVELLTSYNICSRDKAPAWLASVGMWSERPRPVVVCIWCKRSTPCAHLQNGDVNDRM